MRALTLIRPMSAAIVHGTKRIENRPKPPPKWMRDRRVLVAVHAGEGWDTDYHLAVQRIDGPVRPGRGYDLHAKGFVGAMILTGRVFTESTMQSEWTALSPFASSGLPTNPWFSGPHGYEIEWAAPLAEPVAAKGMLGFWTVPDSIAWLCKDLAIKAGIDFAGLISEPAP